MEDLAINGYINDPQCDTGSTTGWDTSGIDKNKIIFLWLFEMLKKKCYMKVKLFFNTKFLNLNLMKII